MTPNSSLFAWRVTNINQIKEKNGGMTLRMCFWIAICDLGMKPAMAGWSWSWWMVMVKKLWDIYKLFFEVHHMFYHYSLSLTCIVEIAFHWYQTGPRSAVGNVSGYRCEADCRSRGREFDPGPVPYFRGDWSWNNFYGHSPHSWRVVVSYKRKYVHDFWLTACSSLPRKKMWLGELTVPQWP